MIKEFLRKIFPDTIWKVLLLLKKNWLAFRYKLFGRTYTPGETTKARNRRLREGFFEKYCKGGGLDIGFGGNLITPKSEGYDFEHGDAQYLIGVEDNSYDFVYSSHTIEHLPSPAEGFKNWFRVVKPGGYLIIYLPHRDLYEKKKTLPSRFNPTHTHFFLIDKDEPPDTIGIVPLVERTLSNYEIMYVKDCR